MIKTEQQKSSCPQCIFTLTRHRSLHKLECKGESGSIFYSYEYITSLCIFLVMLLLNRKLIHSTKVTCRHSLALIVWSIQICKRLGRRKWGM